MYSAVPDFRPKQAVSAESANFGRTFQYEVNCQNSLLWPKLAEISDLAKILVSAEISVSAEVSAFPRGLVSVSVFGPKICLAKNLFGQKSVWPLVCIILYHLNI